MNQQILLTILLIAIFPFTTYGQTIIIKDIDIIPMSSDTIVRKQNVLIKDGVIQQIGKLSNLKKEKETSVINGKGKFLMPGLSDMHVHLPELGDMDYFMKMNIAAGITHIRVMNTKSPQNEVKEFIATKQLDSPNIHYSRIIRRDETFSEKQADSLMTSIMSQKIDFIKIFSLSSEATFDHLMQSANHHGITVGGHYPTFREDDQTKMVAMEKVITSGYKSIEHLSGYNWLQSESQIVEAIELTKQNKTFNCPTLDWDIVAYGLQYPNDYKNRMTYQSLPKSVTENWENELNEAITDFGKDKFLEQRENYLPKFDFKQKILQALYQNGCLLLIGGDAEESFQAPGFNIYEEMQNWSNIGIDNFTILKSATKSPALFFNQSEEWGTIEIGKNADLIILTKNPLEDIKNIATVETTVINGIIYNTKKTLNKITTSD